MELRDVIESIEVKAVEGSLETTVTSVCIDSRQVKPGSLFVAIRGTQTDGHQFIGKAIEQGASAIMCEESGWEEYSAHPSPLAPCPVIIRVADTEAAIGPVATAFYRRPSEKLTLVGVTGTNGKTTIATLLYNMFRTMGHKCGLLSTVCNYIDGEPVAATHTTPDPIELNALLRRMADAGCEYVFMECSSHAIAQKRIGGLTFRGGIFTNLTRDHLDYHKTVENYRDAKKAFFDMLPKGSFALTNADDKNGLFMVQNTKAAVKTYSTRTMADYRGRIIEAHFEGMYLEIDGREVGVQFIGRHNVQNLLAVYGAARQLGKQLTRTCIDWYIATLSYDASRIACHVFLLAQQRERLVAGGEGHLYDLRTFGNKDALLCVNTVAQLSLGERSKHVETFLIQRCNFNYSHFSMFNLQCSIFNLQCSIFNLQSSM